MINDRTARILISKYAQPGDEVLGASVAQFGAVETIAKLKTSFDQSATAKRIKAANLAADLKQITQETENCGSEILTPEDSCWPLALNDLDFAAPLCLWVKGDLDLANLATGAISIVGARAATNYGERISSEIGSTLGEWGVTSISGAAYGIDAAAHRGSIAAGGNTIAVLACGIDLAYPSAHKGLLDRICETGSVISESPPGSPPYKQRFLTRNRIIAALSKEVVVVEAAIRSGSLSTANWANAIGRKVWGVPGPITSATSAGVHQGIRNKSMEILLEPGDLVNS